MKKQRFNINGNVLNVHVADNLFTRFRGLMLSDKLSRGQGLLIAPCSSVHMMFMRFAIDVVYLSKGYRILKIVRDLRPWIGVSMCVGAYAALELAQGEADRLQLKVNQVLKPSHIKESKSIHLEEYVQTSKQNDVEDNLQISKPNHINENIQSSESKQIEDDMQVFEEHSQEAELNHTEDNINLSESNRIKDDVKIFEPNDIEDHIKVSEPAESNSINHNIKKRSLRVQIETLGCKVNGVESESIAELFKSHGHKIVRSDADIFVINTCCVTGEAESKSRQAIRKALKSGAKVAVMGCYSQLDPSALKEIGVSVIVGTAERKSLVDKVEGLFNPNFDAKLTPETLSLTSNYEELPHSPSKTRAFMKIQDGCNGKCTYCIIPKVRGKSRSRSLESIIQECHTLIDYKEIVLTGINLGQYGHDLGLTLIDAIKTVLANTTARVRLSSVEPEGVTEELINLIKDEPRICKHLHIPVQSCNDDVLKAMQRNYTVEDFEQMVNRLHAEIPTMMIGVDVILGFPTETEEMFEDTLTCLKELPINHFHIFGYSMRNGTAAAEMEQLYPTVKKARVDKVLELASKKKQQYFKSLIGSKAEVLTERIRNHSEGIYTEGHSSEYIKVYIKGEVPLNEIITVTLTETFKDGMIGIVDKN